MMALRYIYWQEEEMWLGYIEEFPDYMTQGTTLEELQENLKDLYDDLQAPANRFPVIARLRNISPGTFFEN
jgi:hypothetical protein